jgi:internalin A
VGSVGPRARDCRSSADNDCDGRRDDQASGACQCRPGATEACQTHPGLDGNGSCRAGSRTCLASGDGSSSSFGTCTGSVGPGARDCSSNQDNDCNGVPDRQDATCGCQPGTTRGCGTAACPATQSCELSANRSSASFGDCIPGPITFPDANLAAIVRQAVGVGAGPIPGSAVVGLRSLFSNNAGIQSLEGLQCLPDLTEISFFGNQIRDPGVLSSMTRLTVLVLSDSGLTDLSWVSPMSSLRTINVAVNSIRDVRPLTTLPQLDEVLIGSNPIEDLSPLGTISRMRALSLSRMGLVNQDLALIGRLANLTFLDLPFNDLTDLTALLPLTRLTSLNVRANPVNCGASATVTLAGRVATFLSDC